MIKNLCVALGSVTLIAAFCNSPSEAAAPFLRAQQRASVYNWHANYSHSAYGAPVALVVPPTAQLQTSWSWGAPSSHIRRIDHQFGRTYPGPGPFYAETRNTPVWPSSTDQFGVYYVRGPWYPTQR